MKRTRIKFKDGCGGFGFGYAILTDADYIWCFDNKEDDYGYTISKTDIVKIYK